MKEFLKTPHDKFFKEIFSKKENAISFFKKFLPDKLVKLIDFETLKIEDTSFVSKRLKSYFSDLVYSVKLKGADGFFYILFEHKSRKDHFVAFQLLKYMVRIYERYLKQNKGAKKLPLIVPIVLYHGKKGFDFDNSFSFLVDVTDDYLKEFVPDFKFIVTDVTKISDDELKKLESINLALLFLKKIFENDPFEIEKIVDLLFKLKDVEKDRDEIILYLLYLMSGARNISPEALKKAIEEKGGDIMPSLARVFFDEGLQKGKKEGLIEGMQKGMQKGKQEGKIGALREAIIDILEIKFGKVSPETVSLINNLNDLKTLEKLKNYLKKATSYQEFVKFMKKV